MPRNTKYLLLVVLVLLVLGLLFEYHQNYLSTSNITDSEPKNQIAQELMSQQDLIPNSFEQNLISTYQSNPNLNELNRSELVTSAISNSDVDKNDNLIVVGYLYDGYLTNVGFVSKLSKDSRIIWTRFFDFPNTKVGGVAIDSENNIIISGKTSSNEFPITQGSYQETISGQSDFFIVKMTTDADIIWSTLIGGTGEEGGTIQFNRWPRIIGVSIDNEDNIILADSTISKDYPVLNAEFPDAYARDDVLRDWDAVISKFSSTGLLLWSTYLGGNSNDQITSLKIGKNDAIVVSGYTTSWDFFVKDPIQAEKKDYGSFFIAKFNSAGEVLMSTYLDGSGEEISSFIDLDSDDNLYLVGTSISDDIHITQGQEERHGNYDVYICKLTPNGQFYFGKFFGGSDSEFVQAIKVDHEKNIIIFGETLSSDLPTLNAHRSSMDGEKDVFISKFSSSGDLLWSTYLGGDWIESAFTEVDSFNNIIVGGYSGWRFAVLNSFPYNFGDDTGFLAKFNSSGSLIWNTFVTVIPYPQDDVDSDELTNLEEYTTCYESLFDICTNPLDADTDDDGLLDGPELNSYQTNPVDPDTDEDRLFDGNEVRFGTSPISNDTDSDGMDDHWELINNLNGSDPNDAGLDYDNDWLTNLQEYDYSPLLDPRNPDTDGDGMRDGWEVMNQLDPINSDGLLDADEDGLSNFDEYELDTDPQDSDHDNDTMSDGWEIKYGLDPLDGKDANEDKDGDFLPNQLEYELRKFGFKPDSSTDAILSLLSIFTLVGLFILLLIRLRRKKIYAKGLGYETYPDYKKSVKAGFKSAEERIKAISNGFMTKGVQDIIAAAGHRDIWMMLEKWKTVISRVEITLDKKTIESIIHSINRSASPEQLINLKQELDPKLIKLAEEEDLLNSQIALQQILINLQTETDEPLLADLSMSKLNDHFQQFRSMMSDLEKSRNKINIAFEQKRDWFKLWQPLLTLIQITEDGMPIELNRISEVIQSSSRVAEELLEQVLLENPQIGSYDKNRKIYTKGTNIQDYIDLIIARFKSEN
ncbi:MAG: hypothetical protein ACXAD7_02155 [Candidatus Kariarchaeaceae archaeon]|jgi:hypothetical protein